MNNIAYSFDIFDTCITRIYTKPTDLFYDLAYRALNSSLQSYSMQHVHALGKQRRQAEIRARRFLSNREDITVFQIYEHFFELEEWDINPEKMLQEELSLEEESSRPILNLKEQIALCRQNGSRIIFISDMYLPSDFIFRILKKHEIAQDSDSIYVSGDIGLTKHSGNLFKYVLKMEGLRPDQLEHWGDNYYSDITIPRKLGINAFHIDDIRLTRYERIAKRLSHNNPLAFSKIAGISRSVRLGMAHEDNFPKNLASLVSNVIAPILTAFVAWVLLDAKKKNIQRLYFVARNGQIFFKVAKILEKHTETPDCRYIYGSRQAWLLPSVFSCDDENIEWVIIEGLSKSPADILRRLNIEPSNIKNILEEHGFKTDNLEAQLTNEGVHRFRQLLREPALSKIILTEAADARQILLRYFEQEGFDDDVKCALVDIGWTLKCQSALQRIFNGSGRKVDMDGYYFGVGKTHIALSSAGRCSAFISQPRCSLDSKFKCNWLFRASGIILMEHLFTLADHASTIGYKLHGGKAEPIFKGSRLDQKNQDFTNKIHKGVERYAEEFGKSILHEGQLEHHAKVAFNTLRLFITRPKKEDLLAISWISTNAEQAHDDQHIRRLASPFSFEDIINIVSHHLRGTNIRFFDKKYIWLEGSAELSEPLIRYLFYIFFYSKRVSESALNLFARLFAR